MSDYANKLAALAEKKQKIIEEEQKLKEKRKRDIANFAERFELLHASDEFIAGLFAEANKAIKAKDQRTKDWETNGARFLKPTKQNTAETTNA